MPKLAYFVGKIGLVFVPRRAGGAALLVGAAVSAWSCRRGQQWFTFLWASVLGLIACTLAGIAFSVVPKNGEGARRGRRPIVLVLQFTSGVFFQYTSCPTWMQKFSALFPLKWLTQAMRSVFLPPEAAAFEVTGSFELPKCAAVLTAWAIGACHPQHGVLPLEQARTGLTGERGTRAAAQRATQRSPTPTGCSSG